MAQPLRLLLAADDPSADGSVDLQLTVLNDSAEPVMLDRRLLYGPHPGSGELVVDLELAVARVAQKGVSGVHEGRGFQIGPVALDPHVDCDVRERERVAPGASRRREAATEFAGGATRAPGARP